MVASSLDWSKMAILEFLTSSGQGKSIKYNLHNWHPYQDEQRPSVSPDMEPFFFNKN